MTVRDTLGRRSRDVTQSSGKHVIYEDTDLEWLEMIHRLGPQTTAALYERTKHQRRDRKWALSRMKDLRHEDNSDYGGPTLSYPLQQDRTRRPDRNYTVYDITRHAIKALKSAERIYENTPTASPQEWKHGLMGSCLSSSIYLATLERPDLYRFVFHDEIVDRLNGLTTFDVSYSFTDAAGARKHRQAKLRPDGFFGICYLPSGEERIFVREEDCRTERNDTDDPSVKNHKHNILQYLALIANGVSRRKHFGDARVVVLNTFSNSTKMQNVMNLLLKNTENRGSNFMCYQSWDAFGDRFRPPAPRLDLFGEWGRVGNASLDITRV